MSANLRWRLWIGLLIIIMTGGCSSLGSNTAGNHAAAGTAGPAFSLLAGNIELAGSGRQFSEVYKPGITLIELMKNSGIVTFSEDGSVIKTVNKVLLGPEIVWQIQLDDKIITDWHTSVQRGQAIVISAQPAAGAEPLQPILLTVNGGSGQPELTHSHILAYTENLTVRSLLKSSKIVQLSEDNKTILTAMGYAPLSSEDWKLKVNGKTLLNSGVDMKLRPQDELEISLVLR